MLESRTRRRRAPRRSCRRRRGPPRGERAAASIPPDLRASADAALQGELEREVEALGLDEAVAGRWPAVAVVDLADADAPRLAMLNGDEMMYAASLPKIAILLGAFVQAERGNLELHEPSLASLNRMIRASSNADATPMLAKVGEEALLDILTSPRFRFYDPSNGGGLWVGKTYGKSPACRRDPLKGLSHGATAFQVARFCYLLDRGALLPSDLTRQMKSALADPAIRHKFVKDLEKRPDTRLLSRVWNVASLPLGQRPRRGAPAPLHPRGARTGPEWRTYHRRSKLRSAAKGRVGNYGKAGRA